MLCASCAGRAADKVALPSTPTSVILTVRSCGNDCIPYTASLAADGAWTFRQDSDAEQFSGRVDNAKSILNNLVAISRSDRPFELAANQKPRGSTAALTAYTAEGAYWYPVISGQRTAIANFVEQTASHIRQKALRQMAERRAHIAQLDQLSRLEFSQAPFYDCTSLRASAAKHRVTIAVTTRGRVKPVALTVSTPLSQFVNVLRRNGSENLHAIYRAKWHDLTGITLLLKYKDGWQFDLSAPDRTQWPANLTQLVKQFDALLLGSGHLRKICDGYR